MINDKYNEHSMLIAGLAPYSVHTELATISFMLRQRASTQFSVFVL